MTIAPYAPTAFQTPVASPMMGGAGVAYPYISNSRFTSWPTALDVNNLVPEGSAFTQSAALASLIAQASGWVNRLCFGEDVAAKGASLCASLSVEQDVVPVIQGVLRLVCDYKPIIQVNGVDIGFSMANLASVGQQVASQIWWGRRTVFVPVGASITGQLPVRSPQLAVWSYVNGYPHTKLAQPIAVGATSCTVLPTDGASGLLGIIPGVTQLRIADWGIGANSETFTVADVSGTTLTSATPFQFKHVIPTAPDFITVTAMPEPIELAAIMLTMALIKTRGDGSVVLEEMAEPKQQQSSGQDTSDITTAVHLLQPYMVRVKKGRGI